jgi:hypothetical protein
MNSQDLTGLLRKWGQGDEADGYGAGGPCIQQARKDQ